MFPHLMAPLQVGTHTLRNRIVQGAMHTRLETMDRPVERLTAFYRARAAGEAALILTGGHAPSPAGRMDADTAVLASDDDLRHGAHAAITDAVHEEGGKIALQILHAGRYAAVPECVGPTGEQAPINRYAPRALTTAEVWSLVADYAATARLAERGGYDGVEIMGSEGYLINEFVSPRTNTRDDAFGGSLERRFRLPVEIVRAVREAVGPDTLIVYRISAIDLVENGLTGDEVVQLARRLEREGVHLFNTGIGWHESRVPTIAGAVPRAAWAESVRRVTEAVSIPVIASNRVNSPQVAERLLADGSCALVSMARPLLADPDLPRKAREGRPEQITPCIACNQACLDPVFSSGAATCMVNPQAAREVDYRDRIAARPRASRRIAVVGAGPAGVSFALTAAERGDAVTLFDAGDAVGGQLNLARIVPGKAEFSSLVEYFRGELDRRGVTVRTGHRVTAQTLVGDDGEPAFDRVVLATGITPRVPAIDGIDHPKVVTYLDVLGGTARVGRRVAIVGAGGIGYDVAEYLVGDARRSLDPGAFFAYWGVDPAGDARGGLAPGAPRESPPHEITILQRSPGRMGARLGRTTGWILRAALRNAGVRELAGVYYERIDDEGLHVTVDGEARVIAADTVIVCAGQEPQQTLLDALRTTGLPVDVIGGARLAGELDAVRAIREGFEAALDA